jgi:chaperonin GroEL (HSP60 family)
LTIVSYKCYISYDIKKDVLNEMERNLHDALAVCRNILAEPKLLPGGN